MFVYGGDVLGRGMCLCVVECGGGDYLLCVVVCGGELCVSGRRRKCMCEVCGGELRLCVDLGLWLLVVVYEGGLCVLDEFRHEILSCGALWCGEFR